MKKNIEKPEAIKASAARYKGESAEVLIHDAAGDIPEYIYHDPKIYTDDARATLESLPRRDRERFINGLLEKFYYKNPEYAAFTDEIFKDPAKLLNFFKAIKLKDFERAGVPLTGNISPQVVNRYEETQKNIERAEKETENIKDLEAATLKEKWPILRLRDIFTESELAAFYYLQHPKRGPYITEGRTGGRKSEEIPEKMAVITRQGYKSALLAESIFKAPQGAEYDDHGKIKLAGDTISARYDTDGNLLLTAKTGADEKSTVKLINVKNDGIIENIDLPNLSLVFSIMENRLKKQLDAGEIPTAYTTVDAYDLAEQLGTPRTQGKKAIRRAQKAIYDLVGYVGVLQNEKAPGVPNEYSIINYLGTENNQIGIESPYFTFLMSRVYFNSMRSDNDGNTEIDTKGNPLFVPYMSYLIHTDIIKERDRAAIENVKILVQLIETAGTWKPHISIHELLKRNSLLAYKIEMAKDTRRKNLYLKRVFSNTWKYLKQDTDILKQYDKIRIPEKIVPTIQDLDLVLEFTNKKKKHNARK